MTLKVNLNSTYSSDAFASRLLQLVTLSILLLSLSVAALSLDKGTIIVIESLSAGLTKSYAVGIATKYLLASATKTAEISPLLVVSLLLLPIVVVLSLLLHLLATLIRVSLAIVSIVSAAASAERAVIGVALNSLLSHPLLNTAAATSLAALVPAKATSLVPLTTT